MSRWTAERLMPPWGDETRRDAETRLFEWIRTLGAIFARALPFFDFQWVRDTCFTPFSSAHENALRVLAEFAGSVVTRHVFDAAEIPENAMLILGDCVERVINDEAFVTDGYRTGEIYGSNMP